MFLTFIWKFCPELITKGYIYAAVGPLYKVVTGKSFKYLLNDNALETYRKQHSNYQVFRFKGLGEMDPHELAESTMAPEYRTLKQITMTDALAASNTFTALMGEGSTLRKKFIEENAFRANIDV